MYSLYAPRRRGRMSVAYRRASVSLSLLILPSIIHNPHFFREKYATKAEFDSLKAQVDQLVALVQRLIPTMPTANIPYYAIQPGLTGVIPSEAVSGYNPGASSLISNVYSSMMPPPPPPSQPYSQLDTSSSTTRYARPEETPSSSSTRHISQSSLGGSTSNLSPIPSTAPHSPSLARHRALSGDMTSSSSTVRNSPLSLASITSPYHPDPQHLHQQHQQPHSQLQIQPKNCHTQTLILGERLRHGSDGLVISQVRHSPRCWSIVPYLRWVLLRLRLWLLVPHLHFIFNKQGHPVVWVVVIVAILVHLLHPARIESD
jgi:hypothetical protein